MSPLTRPIINIHVRLFRFPRYVIPSQWPVRQRRCPICLIPSCQAQARASHSPTLWRCSDIFIPIFGSCLSSSLISLLPSAAPASGPGPAEYYNILRAGVGGTRAWCSQMSDEWETKGKWNMRWVHRLSDSIPYPSLVTASGPWYNSVISVSNLLHPIVH